MDNLEHLVREESLVNKDLLVCLDEMEKEALKAKEEHRVKEVHLDLQEHQGNLDHKVCLLQLIRLQCMCNIHVFYSFSYDSLVFVYQMI